jgi:hypothetical protein
MNATYQAFFGVLATAVLAALSEILPGGGMFLLVAVAALASVAAIGGTRLPLVLKVWATTFIMYFGYSTCLLGRTMEPGFTGYTVSMALVCFGLLACLPAISLLRLWRPRVAVVLLVTILPLSLTAAALVAGIEERLFVQKYRDTGAGPTPRWTVSNHWLSYDRETHRLNGSD